MVCENEFCIYNRKNKCLISDNRLSLDIQGKCLECCYVRIEKDYLDKLKEEQLFDD